MKIIFFYEHFISHIVEYICIFMNSFIYRMNAIKFTILAVIKEQITYILTYKMPSIKININILLILYFFEVMSFIME